MYGLYMTCRCQNLITTYNMRYTTRRLMKVGFVEKYRKIFNDKDKNIGDYDFNGKLV